MERLADDPAVAQVRSALADPRRPSPFVSRDGRSSFVAVFLRSGADGEDAGARMRNRSTASWRARRWRRGRGPGRRRQVSEDLAKAELLAFPLLFLLTLIVFRGAIAALLPLFVGLMTIMCTFLGLRLFNEATSLSIFALNLAIGLGLGLAIDYSLFILSRYREEMARRRARPRGADAHAAHAGRTVVFSSLRSRPRCCRCSSSRSASCTRWRSAARSPR